MAGVVMTLAILIFFSHFLACLKYLLYLCIRITLVFPNGPCEGPQETPGLFLFECYVECFPTIFPYFCFQLPDFAVNMYLVLIVTRGASFSLLLYILDVFFGCHILYFSQWAETYERELVQMASYPLEGVDFFYRTGMLETKF